ncbi:hypothetical protein ACLMJK_000135 [Lecanora helva]
MSPFMRRDTMSGAEFLEELDLHHRDTSSLLVIWSKRGGFVNEQSYDLLDAVGLRLGLEPELFSDFVTCSGAFKEDLIDLQTAWKLSTTSFATQSAAVTIMCNPIGHADDWIPLVFIIADVDRARDALSIGDSIGRGLQKYRWVPPTLEEAFQPKGWKWSQAFVTIANHYL